MEDEASANAANITLSSAPANAIVLGNLWLAVNRQSTMAATSSGTLDGMTNQLQTSPSSRTHATSKTTGQAAGNITVEFTWGGSASLSNITAMAFPPAARRFRPFIWCDRMGSAGAKCKWAIVPLLTFAP